MNPIFKKLFLIFFIAFFLCSSLLFAQEQLFLLRYVPSLRPQESDLTTESAEYKAVFGTGDSDSEKLHGVVRFGELTVMPGGASAIEEYPDEEQIYFIHEGAGTLHYDVAEYRVKRNDYIYFPPGIAHGISNNTGAPVRLLIAGYRIPEGTEFTPKPELQIASADNVELQILGWHGPTTQFKLLMGTTESTRDRLAAASQMNSMFIMDFAPHGTNIPHRHPREEEIYYVLQGTGSMVAGLDVHGNVVRHPSQSGDAIYFAAGTEVGFYSGAKEGEDHTLILAFRSTDPEVARPGR